MEQSVLLLKSVMILSIYMVWAYILCKKRIVGETFALNMSKTAIYVCQAALSVVSYTRPFEMRILSRMAAVFVFSCIAHGLFIAASSVIYRDAPENRKKVLRFGTVFSNAGYMGLPLINMSLGTEYSIYVLIYIVVYNLLCFSYGRYLYTEDRKYISIKEMIVNAGVIPIIIGLVIYLSGMGGWIIEQLDGSGAVSGAVSVIYSALKALGDMVAPVSMLLIGARLAAVDFKGLFDDKYMYRFLFGRLLLMPFLMWCVLRLSFGMGLLEADLLYVILVISATPGGAVTTIFAEFYNADSAYAGKIVAVSTVLSIFTMPLVSMLAAI